MCGAKHVLGAGGEGGAFRCTRWTTPEPVITHNNFLYMHISFVPNIGLQAWIGTGDIITVLESQHPYFGGAYVR